MVRAVVAVVALAAVLAACGGDDDATSRQVEVAARGALVMPFDLDRTTHVFAPSSTGGVQTVVVDDPADREQIGLVREHLAEEAAKFRVGDFGDPARIHGADMPGLADLESGFAAIDVTYTDIDAGARITYAATDPDLVIALHRWFEAQVSDHGDHAEHGEHGTSK